MEDKKILLVIDDDRATLGLYEEVLKGAGYTVTMTPDGQEGLKLAQEGGYSAILLDIIMPKLDGIGLLTALKNNPPKKPNGPIVVMTNLSGDPVIKQALNLGAKECFIKTEVTPDQILEKLAKIVA